MPESKKFPGTPLPEHLVAESVEPPLPFSPEPPLSPRPKRADEPTESYPKIEKTDKVCRVCDGKLVKRTDQVLDVGSLSGGGPVSFTFLTPVYCETCGLLYDGKALGVA